MHKQNKFKKWGKIREKGKRHFIIYYGVLGWGLSAGILSFILQEIVENKLNIAKYFTGDWILSLLFGLVSFLLGGIMFGYFMWGINENYYHDKYSNK